MDKVKKIMIDIFTRSSCQAHLSKNQFIMQLVVFYTSQNYSIVDLTSN